MFKMNKNVTLASQHNLCFSKLMTVKELAIALGKSENSIRYHIRMGRIKPALKFGRNMSFDYDQVIKQLKRGVSS